MLNRLLGWFRPSQKTGKSNPPPGVDMGSEMPRYPRIICVTCEEDWRQLLTEDEYRVCRLGQSDKAFEGQFCEVFTAGTYVCRCCGTALFSSKTKADTGTGWPSFLEPIKRSRIYLHPAERGGVVRHWARCSACDARLGEWFPPEGRAGGRYCINSTALKLPVMGNARITLEAPQES
ncbi:peptide-methionine (R)-S-oxide reductase [Pseudomonas nitroreducens]|uniref:peptide-methionine (R)-S-oxide reductase n=1 Tax=Pseudomonas nitroreducens TaxID=46680 RepID=UPI00390894F9